MKRLRFTFIRKGEVGQTGECTVDVENENDGELIQEKLSNQDFSEFVTTSSSIYEDTWEFTPMEEKPNGKQAA